VNYLLFKVNFFSDFDFCFILHFQVFILDSLSNYSPKDDREAQSICERITPRLAHANAAVVLSAVKVS
jgi:Vesicle coat complex, various subunits